MSPKKQKTKKVSVETERERVKGEITSWWNKWLSEEQDREEEDTVALGFIWADWAAQSGRAQKHIVSEAASAMNHENDPWTPWYTMTQWRCDTYHDRGWGGLGLLQSHTKVYFLTLLQSCLESLSLVPKAIFTNMPRIYLFLPLDELMLHDVILSSIFFNLLWVRRKHVHGIDILGILIQSKANKTAALFNVRSSKAFFAMTNWHVNKAALMKRCLRDY